jgi:hypothetical protein
MIALPRFGYALMSRELRFHGESSGGEAQFFALGELVFSRGACVTLATGPGRGGVDSG